MARKRAPKSSSEGGAKDVSSGGRLAYWKGLIKAFAIEWALLCVLALIVALLMNLFRHTDTVQSLDRGTSDLIMRHLARDALAGPASNRFGARGHRRDKVGHQKPRKQNEPCSAGFSTPRGELADLVSSLLSAILVARQCGWFCSISNWRHNRRARTMPTNSFAAKSTCWPTVYRSSRFARQFPRLWVRQDRLCVPIHPYWTDPPAVPLLPRTLQTTSGSARRSSVRTPTTSFARSTSGTWSRRQSLDQSNDWQGMGLLGAALLDGKVDPGVLACLFPASHAKPEDCPKGGLTIGGHAYEPGTDEADAKARIVFSLPWGGDPERPVFWLRTIRPPDCRGG